MPVVEQSALLPYTDQQMFDLVNDIESYPQYMDGCLEASIISRSGDEICGRLKLGMAGLSYEFSTRNILIPPHEMAMELIEGPFKKFHAVWQFKALSNTACKTSLYLEFEFSSGLIDLTLKKLFENTSKNLVKAVCIRADKIYG